MKEIIEKKSRNTLAFNMEEEEETTPELVTNDKLNIQQINIDETLKKLRSIKSLGKDDLTKEVKYGGSALMCKK